MSIELLLIGVSLTYFTFNILFTALYISDVIESSIHFGYDKDYTLKYFLFNTLMLIFFASLIFLFLFLFLIWKRIKPTMTEVSKKC